MDDLDLGSTLRGFSAGQKVFNRYTLVRILGRGGMGVVWLARDEELDRDVALKFLPEVVAMDRQSVVELKRETRRSLELTHPNIIRIHDFVQQGHTAAISMEYVAGDTLASLKMDQPNHVYSPSQLERWIAQLCAAMEYAHGRAQVVHRDLKPANLMIDTRGDLKIADFGIAASVSDSVSRVSAQAGSSGTPVYMSPQQMMGEKPAVTDDIYSIGATLYDLLTGKPPFHAGNVMMQVQNKVPARLNDRRREFGLPSDMEPVPDAWEDAIAACLAKDPAARPQSAADLAQRLGWPSDGSPTTAGVPGTAPSTPPPPTVDRKPAAAASAPPSRRRIASRVVAGIAALLLAGGAGWYLGLHLPEQRRLETEHNAEQARRAEQQRLVQLEEKKRADEISRLAALRIPVTVRTQPAGAEIRIGGEAAGVSPVIGRRLPLGEHDLVARLPGYEEVSQRITVQEGGQSEWTIALARSTGTLRLEGKPGDALYTVFREGGPAADVQAEGRLPANDLNLPTGRYRVVLAPHKDSVVVHEEIVEVTRNEITRIEADVRGGTVVIDSSPQNAAIRINGREAGRTPLALANQVPGEKLTVELALRGYLPQSKSVTVGPPGNPVNFFSKLEQKPAITLPVDFSTGPAEFRIETSMTAKTIVRAGESAVNSPDAFARSQEIVSASVPDGEGLWKRVVTRYEASPGYSPNAVVQFDRTSEGWRSQLLQGETAAGAHSAAIPSYPLAYLTAEALPTGEIRAGRTWDVPLPLANIVVPGSRFQLRTPNGRQTPPTGSIRGAIKAADLTADKPWMELEYTFDVSGPMTAPDDVDMPGTKMTMTGREFGSWTMRVWLDEKYASHMAMRKRSQITTVVAPEQKVNVFGIVTGGSTPISTTSVEIDTTFESSVTPLDAAAAAKAPVGSDDPVVIHFYRKRAFEGGGNDIQVHVGGEKVGTMDNGGYFTVKRPPGRVRISLQYGAAHPRDYDLEFVAGETVYYRLGLIRAPFDRLSETEFRQLAGDVEPTQPQVDQTGRRRID